MFCVRLKDGSLKEFESPVTGLELAQKISPSLAKKAAFVMVSDQPRDLSEKLPHDAHVELVTREDERALDIIRHDCAHLMAEAVKTLFPDVLVTIGPSIEDGFYYDFYRESPFVPEELEKIERKMRALVDDNKPFIRHVLTRQEAIKFFEKQGERFKVELIHAIPQDQLITVYEQGSFKDLCRGPHMPSTGYIGKAFKLTKISGAYWRGDSKNPMLQRIYGTAWASQEQLDAYLKRIEEAEKRDHRKIGPALGLFHLQEEAPGCVFWHDKGWRIFLLIQNYVRKMLFENGYIEVNTPVIADQKLWELSGHWEKFRENMFVIEDEPRGHVLKPMNCPCHVQIFKQGIKSYRDLPLRMAEFGCCHRNEPKGALHGIMRVRAFVQDDAHIFCTPDQIVNETKNVFDLLKEIYAHFGFHDIHIKFASRPEKRAGSDEVWDLAEKALEDASKKAGISYKLNVGEGAFYGPKLEFGLKDALGREWQCGTFQVDFVLPERLDAYYIDEHGEKKRPVMLHRALLGSLERFIGVLIEHYEGKFPLWLAPVQAVVATITSDSEDYAQKVFDLLKEKGVRAELDVRNEKISYKVREHSVQKIPYILVVGKNEAASETVTARKIGSPDQETIALSNLSTFFQPSDF